MTFVPENKNPRVLKTPVLFALRPEDIEAHHDELAHLRGEAAVQLIEDITSLIVDRFRGETPRKGHPAGIDDRVVCGGCLAPILIGLFEHVAMAGGLNRKEAVDYLEGAVETLDTLAETQHNTTGPQQLGTLLETLLGDKSPEAILLERIFGNPRPSQADFGDVLAKALGEALGVNVSVKAVSPEEFGKATASADPLADQHANPRRRRNRDKS